MKNMQGGYLELERIRSFAISNFNKILIVKGG